MATFVARPLTPVEIGKPVQFVSVPLAGVPKIGVVEFVSRRPVVPLKVAICPEVTVPPVFVTTLAANTPESVTILPVAPEKLARRPDIEAPEFVTTLAATTPESVTILPVAPEKLVRLPECLRKPRLIDYRWSHS